MMRCRALYKTYYEYVRNTDSKFMYLYPNSLKTVSWIYDLRILFRADCEKLQLEYARTIQNKFLLQWLVVLVYE